MTSCLYSHCQGCKYTLADTKPGQAGLETALAWFQLKKALRPLQAYYLFIRTELRSRRPTVWGDCLQMFQ